MQLTGPAYPPNTVAGGTVVAELQVEEGRVAGVKILSGEEPFAASVRAALEAWELDSDEKGNELVVAHFRQPYLFDVGDTAGRVPPGQPGEGLPYPKHIVAPVYAANASGRGSVILRVGISSDGEVSEIDVIKPLGVLTEASIEAVKKWKFSGPAQSRVYAVLVFREPPTSR